MTHSALPIALLAGISDLPAELVAILFAAVIVALVGGGVGVWRLYGAGPRRNRAYVRARAHIQKGDWRSAQQFIDEIRSLATAAPEWQGRLNNLDGECQRAAGEAALAGRDYEQALERHLAAAKLLHTSPTEARARVREAMLAELRQGVATEADEKSGKLAARILQLEPGCAEASFWQALIFLRQRRPDAAQNALRTAYESTESKGVEPALYLGMLLVREDTNKDGIRFLAEANRLAPNSPLVSWQLGTGLVVGSGDPTLALRALQKAAGPDGLPKLAKTPETFWIEALPEGSWIGNLAAKYSFDCPILGSNVAGMVRQARMALGQALFRQDRITEAVAVFRELINESEPSPSLSRSLGIALCRLEHFDEAYTHLKSAHEREELKNPLTTCYLAYSAAKAPPVRREDRPANVARAVRLLADLAIPIEAEPARLVAAVYAEARALELPVPVAELARLCDTLAALNATDSAAAGAFDQLAAAAPNSVRPPHAFLYGQAALQGFRGNRDLELLEQVFKNPSLADEFHQARGWRLADVERRFLERWSERHNGFPSVFGPDYPARCEQSLLERAKAEETAGDSAGARASVDLLRRLIPVSTATFDQLAKLAWHRGEPDEALRLLHEWLAQDPENPIPRLRLAVVEQNRGQADVAAEHVRVALTQGAGPTRGKMALVGAKLAIKAGRTEEAIRLLKDCLQQLPEHPDALALLAALYWRAGDLAGLAKHAPRMNRDSGDVRFQYLAAVCQMQSGDLETATQSARSAEGDPSWAADGKHLLGAIHFRRGDFPAATMELEAALQAPDTPCADQARAWLGRVRWEQGAYVDTARLWHDITPEKRRAWGLDAVLPGVTFLAGVQSLRAAEAGKAAHWLSRARELGWPEPKLPSLQERAVIHAAHDELRVHVKAPLAALAPLLEKTTRSRGAGQWPAALLLAIVYRRQEKLAEAREVLRRPGAPTPDALRQLGLIALQDRQPAFAEEAFARALQLEPDDETTAINLLWTRLSLGQLESARDLLAGLLDRPTHTAQRNLLNQLYALLQGGPGTGPALADITGEEEARLIDALVQLGRLETSVPLLCLLAAARPTSRATKDAQTIGMIRLGKQRFDRGDWLGAEKWLSPLAKARPTAAVRNLLGMVACLTQDYASGILHLQEALRLAGDDPRIHQNLALAFTWQGEHIEADLCWGRFLGTMAKNLPRPPGFIDYHDQLRFQVLKYLGNEHYERERWTEALSYIEEAHRLQPENVDLADRLFLLQIQAGRRDEARKTLEILRQLRPKHPTYELYELDLIEVRTADDLENLLETLGRVVEQMHGDAAAQEKAVLRVLPTLQFRADQLTKQMREIREDLRRLYEDSPGWYDALKDLRVVKRHLRRLRQITRYCAALPIAEAHRRRLDELTDDLERKIDYCRRWEEED